MYFVDTCGNPANIYDATKVNDKEYWSAVKSKAESCNPDASNAGSSSCGNCNYLLGSFGRNTEVADGRATYGDFICADLNCRSTSNGQSYRHGESWCVNNDHGAVDTSVNSVGSEFFRHICINGEEVVESCDGFRAETCIQGEIEGFSQAACRVNRWQDCTAQDNQNACENTDQRDCLWVDGVTLGNSTANGACVPKNSPGLEFWNSDSVAQEVCAQANLECVVTFEEGLFGGRECVENCECLNEEWQQKRVQVARALGDCSATVNWVGKAGNSEGFEIFRK